MHSLSQTLRTFTWLSVAVLTGCYVATLIQYSPLAFTDYPAHIARATVLQDLIYDSGLHFRRIFTFHPAPIPYLLGDLFLATAIHFWGISLGSGVWVSLVLLSLPAALLLYMRAHDVKVEDYSLVVLVSLYLATDWFFVMGFLSFRLAVAITILTLAIAAHLRTHWSWLMYLGYVVAVVLGYLTHLATLLFIAVGASVSGLLRLHLGKTYLRNEAWLIVPIALIVCWHFGVATTYTLPGDPSENPYTWGTATGKIVRLGSEFLRFSKRGDLSLFLAFVGCLLLCLMTRPARDGRMLEWAALATAYVGLYVVLPIGYSEAWFVDVRPLALVSVFALLTCAAAPSVGSARATRITSLATMSALLLAAGNLGYLIHHLSPLDTRLRQYRDVVARLPHGSHVLPIYTCCTQGSLRPLLHASSFITIDRQGLIPYEFAAETANPEKYFRYIKLPYRPEETWYMPPDKSVNWNSVSKDYDYLLITKPFEPSRIRLPVQLIAENDGAALVAIDRARLRRAALDR